MSEWFHRWWDVTFFLGSDPLSKFVVRIEITADLGTSTMPYMQEAYRQAAVRFWSLTGKQPPETGYQVVGINPDRPIHHWSMPREEAAPTWGTDHQQAEGGDRRESTGPSSRGGSPA